MYYDVLLKDYFFRGMDKELVYIYTVGYFSAIKKNEIMLSAAPWLDFDIIMLSEVNQIQREKYLMTPLICGI